MKSRLSTIAFVDLTAVGFMSGAALMIASFAAFNLVPDLAISARAACLMRRCSTLTRGLPGH